MSAAKERAARRRAEWTAEVVEAGASKGLMYRDLSPKERLAAFAALNARVWTAAGYDLDPGPRSDWPGEVFDISVHD